MQNSEDRGRTSRQIITNYSLKTVCIIHNFSAEKRGVPLTQLNLANALLNNLQYQNRYNRNRYERELATKQDKKVT